MELYVETHVLSDDCKKRMQQFIDSQAQRFMACWFATIFFLKLLFIWIWWIYFFIYRKHITGGWRKDTETIFQPTQISIWIYGWR